MISKLPHVTAQTLHAQAGVSIVVRSNVTMAAAKRSFTVQAEPNRFGLENKPNVMKWKHSHCTPNRTGPNLFTGCLFVFTRQPTTDSVAQ